MSNKPRCLYDNSISNFICDTEDAALGSIVSKYHGEVRDTAIDAWKAEITIMQEVLFRLPDYDGHIIFEYDIPRLGKRIDVVLLYKGIVFCIEFKVGETRILEADVDQVLDYALDLKNFHKFSQDKVIVPILIATRYNGSSSRIQMSVYDDNVVNPLVTGEEGLYKIIKAVLDKFPNETPVENNWIISPYSPTPTIIEAARALYENHTVEDIKQNE